jgi:hypothetical protein
MRTAFGTVLLAALLLLVGCARQVPASRLAEDGGDVEVRLTTTSGESLTGRVVALSSAELVVDAVYVEGEGVEIEGTRDARRVTIDGETIDGEVREVERSSEGRVTAIVRRSFSIREVESAEFARSRREATLGALLSQIAGPAVGLLLGLLVQG